MSALRARWIRLGPVALHALNPVCGALAGVQSAAAEPIVLWAQPVAVGAGSGAPRFAFALIVPRRLAPGRATRWVSWALAPAVATYRTFGLPAYLNEGALWLHGRRIAACTCVAVGACAVIASGFLSGVAAGREANDGAPEFRRWLREGLALSAAEWSAPGEALAERALEDAFRARLAAQYGWSFENDWPDAAEAAAVASALDAQDASPPQAVLEPLAAPGAPGAW